MSFTVWPPRPLHVVSSTPPSRHLQLTPFTSSLSHRPPPLHPPPTHRLHPTSFISSPFDCLHHAPFLSSPSHQDPLPASFTSSPPRLLHIVSPRLLHIVSTPPPSHRLHPASFTSSPPCLLHIVSTPPLSHRLHPTSFISFPSDRQSPPRLLHIVFSPLLHPATFTLSPPRLLHIISTLPHSYAVTVNI